MSQRITSVGLGIASALAPALAWAEGSMPQLRFETFPSQIFWLVVTFSALYVVVDRIVLPQVRSTLGAREKRIGADRDQAEELRKEAEAAHHRAGEALAAARADGDRILREAHERAAEAFRVESQRVQEALDAERTAAEARIAASKADALREAGSLAADLVRFLTASLTMLNLDGKTLAAAVSQAAREEPAP